MQIRVRPSLLRGTIQIPSSKSHTMRAILLASLARGKSRIQNDLLSPDTEAMINACQAFGAKIESVEGGLWIEGVSGAPHFSTGSLQVGNSGQVFRFIAAIAALDNQLVVIDGDESIRYLRPITPLLDALRQLGVKISKPYDQQAPIQITGPMLPGLVEMAGQDSQPVSALLMACSFLPGPTEIKVTNPSETPWIDLTLDWLKRVGIGFDVISYQQYRLHGYARIDGFDYQVNGDFSALAFPLIAGIITKSALTFTNLDFSDIQGDKKIIYLLQDIGINLTIHRAQRSLELLPSPAFLGFDYDMSQMIDALPILAVLACFASTATRLYNAQIARKKESDRIAAMAKGLKMMGAHLEEQADGLLIYPSSLQGAQLESEKDHRIAMAFLVAGFAAQGETIVNDTACIEKSYPEFVTSFQKIGAVIE